MAQIVFTEAGARLGAQFLPNGLGVLGARVAGPQIGRAVGSFVGGRIDAALFGQDQEGPRLEALHVMESREGAPVPLVYGRMRVAGQVIWAARFKEKRRETSAGGKGGPTRTDYTYSVSFAVGICEGEITRLERVWANGEPLALSGITHRLYLGSEDQPPDALIEAVEGAGNAPAYRGLAYIVFEDLPLDAFGNRLPQLSFEVTRRPPPSGSGEALTSLVEGVNIIPASGEFVYATDIVRSRYFPGIEQPLNMNNSSGAADFELSLDQLETDLPKARSAALTIGWFGDDLRAEHCSIRPGVETREKITTPLSWSVGGVGRAGAYLISSDAEGNVHYGGTPSDAAVIQGIQAMKARGIAVTISPFLFMDVPPGNGLTDPYGGPEQAAFPWRGRICVSTDQTASTRAEIDDFLGSAQPGDFQISGSGVQYTGAAADHGFRRFILHQAWLAKAAGGVDAFLLGSEMVALTRARDDAGAFPFVEGLMLLASDVRAILGPDVDISYAADWTEYGAYQAGGGDVLFPLDALWADQAIDFVGIDWYPPMGDWRDGESHLDALAGYSGPEDEAYLYSQLEGGEAYDWFYADEAARGQQNRTPIVDTAHGEDWIFRAKDIRGWWENAHHHRLGGVRDTAPTAWAPMSKPIRLSEIGFPAVDKGTNSPNLFYDPKSSESALPPYSNGARDDRLQRRALEVSLAHFKSLSFVEEAMVWAWDARPWPAFPVRENVWSDGPSWSYGHWLNGRTGFAPLRDVVADICVRAGVSEVDTGQLQGGISGYTLNGVYSARHALGPLAEVYEFGAVEKGRLLSFEGLEAGGAPLVLSTDDLVEGGLRVSRSLLDKAPGRLRLSFADVDADLQPTLVDVKAEGGDADLFVDASIPVAMSAGEAEAVARRRLSRLRLTGAATADAPMMFAALEPGDAVTVNGGEPMRISEVSDSTIRTLSLVPVLSGYAAALNVDPPQLPDPAPVFAAPELIVLNPPALPGEEQDTRPLAALSGEPWGGPYSLRAGPDEASLTERAQIVSPAVMGRLEADLEAGPVGRWDEAGRILVTAPEQNFSGITPVAALAGGNAAFIQNDDGWELLIFRDAELVSGDTYELTGLLRGLQGTQVQAASEGSAFLLANAGLVRMNVRPAETGLPLIAQAGQTQTSFTPEARATLPWPVAHLRARLQAGSYAVSWVRRGADIPDGWDLPDPLVTPVFSVETQSGGLWSLLAQTTDYEITASAGIEAVRVAEKGADGRLGPWVSIAL